MHLSRYCPSTLLIVVLPFSGGCYAVAAAKSGPIIDEIQDLACAMYDAREDDLGPPLPIHANEVRRLGSGKFAGWLAQPLISHWHCQSLCKYVYAIGWFGDIWHLDLIAKWLEHEDPEVRRSALAAFSRLTAQRFDSPEDALAWWGQHSSDFPRFEPDDNVGEADRPKSACAK